MNTQMIKIVNNDTALVDLNDSNSTIMGANETGYFMLSNGSLQIDGNGNIAAVRIMTSSNHSAGIARMRRLTVGGSGAGGITSAEMGNLSRSGVFYQILSS